MRNVKGDSLYRYNKVRMAFNLTLKLFNVAIICTGMVDLCRHSHIYMYVLHIAIPSSFRITSS